MNIFNIPEKKPIPYYDEQGDSFYINIKRVAGERGMSLFSYVGYKLKISTIQFLANKCPVNSLRVYLYRRKGVKIGANVYIGRKVFIDNLYPDFIFLEDDVHLHTECMIISHFNPPKRFSNLFEASAKPVFIKKGAIIGLRAIIMPGITIGQNSMVTAGSVVFNNIAPYTMVQGNPAKKILNFEHLM
jgi:acetyltransferase-like isoleucine patch superfamily enzyme